VIAQDESSLAEALAVLAVSRRDEKAWENLYRLCWPFVRTVVYRRLGGVEGLADDAAQEVFVRLLRSCPFAKLRSPDAFRGYLWRVSDNVARNYRRRIATSPTVALPDEEGFGVSGPGAGLPEDVELGHLLQDLWHGLSSPERRLLRMLIDGYTVREIADKLGISYGATAIRVMRLRGKLRKSLICKGLMVGMETKK
jgi:RNA polymerase sigma factor (sigma-70 family)